MVRTIKLGEARLCVNCETLHNSFYCCPTCGSPNWIILAKVLGSLCSDTVDLTTIIVGEVGDASGFHSKSERELKGQRS